MHDIMVDSDNNIVITVGRQFGSGGREFGRRLAETLGFEFYDKRLLLEAARMAGMDVSFFERSDEKFPTFVSGSMAFNLGYNPMPWYTASSISDESLYRDIATMINSLADKGSCVIVGRSADYVLRNHPTARVISLFVHAPIDICVRRILERGDCDNPKAARQLAEKSNKLRAEYYNFYTDRQWGHAATYDLCLDSGSISMEDAVALVRHYITLRYPDVELPEAAHS